MPVTKAFIGRLTLKRWSKLTTAARAQFSTLATDSSDIELSYTTYSDHEHKLDDKKRPLVFTHGLFGAKGNLHSVSKHISDNGRKVVTYDARNHGDSDHSPEMNYHCMAEDLSGLLEDLNLHAPVVMGHSMGGKTAMTLALSQPSKMTALIVSDVAPGPSPGISDSKKFAEAMKVVNIPPGTSLAQARKSVQVQLTPAVENRAILQFLLTNLKKFEGGEIRWRMNLDAFLNNYESIGGFPMESAIPFTKPTLFVFGADSGHYRGPGVKKIKTLFPNSEITAIEGAGHFVHADKPLEFVRVVNQFLEKIDAIPV